MSERARDASAAGSASPEGLPCCSRSPLPWKFGGWCGRVPCAPTLGYARATCAERTSRCFAWMLCEGEGSAEESRFNLSGRPACRFSDPVTLDGSRMKQLLHADHPRGDSLRVVVLEEGFEDMPVGRQAVGPEILTHERMGAA